MRRPRTHQIQTVTGMLAHCSEKYQSIHNVSFSSETIPKPWEAMQVRFHQSYAILSRVHKTSSTTFIQNKLKWKE